MENPKRNSLRGKFWDYSRPAKYFITLCTHNRECILCDIHEGKVNLTPVGRIVKEEWLKSFELRPTLKCHEWEIMPNHLHGLVEIIETKQTETLQKDEENYFLKLNKSFAYRPPISISSFIAGFKSSATKKINELKETPGARVWQPRFYDSIIMSEKEFFAVKNYIKNNPRNWGEDDFFKGD